MQAAFSPVSLQYLQRDFYPRANETHLHMTIQHLKFCIMVIFVLDRVENIVGKGVNAVYQHLLLFQLCFQMVSLSGSSKMGLYGNLGVFNPLPNDQILDWPKFKAFAEDNLNVAKMMVSLYDRVENIVGKGENAGYQHFLLFPQCFQKASSIGSLKTWDFVVKS